MIKLSIIVPVYNVAEYLERCLNSLINQTLNEIEIICVNDGSTDNSLCILEKFAGLDKRIKIINQKNKGLSGARNTGIKLVQGEYFGFLDSDDWVDLDYFEKLYKRAKNCDADISLGDFIRKGKFKHKIRLKLNKEEEFVGDNEKFYGSQFYHFPCVWNKIYKTSKFNDLRFIEGIFFEDGPYTIQTLHRANKVVTCCNTYLYYFVNPNSIVKTLNKKKEQDMYNSSKFILNYIKDNMQIQDKGIYYETFAQKLWRIKLYSTVENLYYKKYYIHLLFWKILIYITKKN